MCQLLFFISNTKAKPAPISKAIKKQTQILSSKISSQNTCFHSKTTARCFIQHVHPDVPSPLFTGGISFQMLASSVHDGLHGEGQTHKDPHTWFISAFFTMLCILFEQKTLFNTKIFCGAYFHAFFCCFFAFKSLYYAFLREYFYSLNSLKKLSTAHFKGSVCL